MSLLWLIVALLVAPTTQQCPGTEATFSDVRTDCGIAASDLNKWFDVNGNVFASQQSSMVAALQEAGSECLCAVEDWYKTFGTCTATTRAADPNWALVSGLRLAGKCSDCSRDGVEAQQFNDCIPEGCIAPMSSFVASPKDTLSKTSAKTLCDCYTDLVKCWRHKNCFSVTSCTDNLQKVSDALDEIDYQCSAKASCGESSGSSNPASGTTSPATAPSDEDSESKSETSETGEDSKDSDSQDSESEDSDESDDEDSEDSDSEDSKEKSKGFPNWGVILIVVAIVVVIAAIVALYVVRRARARNFQRGPPHKDYYGRRGGGGPPPQMYAEYPPQQQQQHTYDQYGADQYGAQTQAYDQYSHGPPNPMGNMPPHSPPHSHSGGGGPPMSPYQ